MFRKSKSTIILFILILSVIFSACQRLNGSDKDAMIEDVENKLEDGIKDKGKNTLDSFQGPEILIPFAKGEGFEVLYGYNDKKGKIAIEAMFKNAEPFYESGVAVVGDINGNFGLINTEGEYIITPQWDYLFYSEGLFIGYEYDISISAVFDEKGKLLFQREGFISEYSEGLSPVYEDIYGGYMDKFGNIAIEPKYDVVTPFNNGIAEVAQVYMGPSHYIDKKGNDLTEAASSNLRMYQDYETGLFGFLNQQQEIEISAQFSEASPFLNGYAIVNTAPDIYNGRYGIIDTKGNFALEPKYCGIIRTKNGLIVVGEEVYSDTNIPYMYFDYCKKALFSPDLKKSTDFVYNIVSNFDDQNVCVNDEDSVLFINAGLEVSKSLPRLLGRGEFVKDGDLIRGKYNSRLTVLDKKGNIISQNSGAIDMGSGVIALKQDYLPTPLTNLSYPIISGMGDNLVQNQINDLIYNEMVAPYEDFVRFNGPDDTTYVDTSYTVTKEKQLLLIDQYLYMYYLGGAHGNNFRNTIYIDTGTGVKYELKDLFNANPSVWSYLSHTISGQMQEKMYEMGYWDESLTVGPDAFFALNKDGIVIYYGEGDIAAYAAGMQEFFVPFSELTEYINTQGDFWRAFN